jgi:hypothetical protein
VRSIAASAINGRFTIRIPMVHSNAKISINFSSIEETVEEGTATVRLQERVVR